MRQGDRAQPRAEKASAIPPRADEMPAFDPAAYARNPRLRLDIPEPEPQERKPDKAEQVFDPAAYARRSREETAQPTPPKRQASPAGQSPFPEDRAKQTSHEPDNVEFAPGQVISASERLREVRNDLLTQAIDWSNAIAPHAHEAERAELKRLWRRIGHMGEVIAELQQAEREEARLMRQRGRER